MTGFICYGGKVICPHRHQERIMGKAYKLKPFYGNLPTWEEGPNIGRLDRYHIAVLYNFSKEEVNKAYLNWMEVFRIEDSTLTFEEYLDKLWFNGLTPSDVGTYLGQYNLSRYNDEGPYTKESCRFILKEDNLAEQKH